MLEGDFVTDDAGTGFVHMAPSHGADDYELFVKHGLVDRMTHNVLEDFVLRRARPVLRRPAGLRRQGQGGQGQQGRHRQADRGGRAPRPRPDDPQLPPLLALQGPGHLPQHAAMVRRHRQAARRRHGHLWRRPSASAPSPPSTAWSSGTPVSGRNRLFSMIEARPDWVLSRQRAWGVPLTCFVKRHPDGTAEILRDPAVNARIKDAFEHEGADAWFEENAKARFLGNDHPHEDWEKVTDILDVWFDSGSTHAFALRDRPDGIWPASVYLEGTDQHRGWFHSSMLQSCGTRGRAPYDAVVTHGFTLDENGMKMSKSLGQRHRPAGRGQAVRRRHPPPLGGADRLHRRPAHRPGDPQGHRRQLPPPAQHAALPPRRPRRLRRGRAHRAGRDARARALGPPPPAELDERGAQGLRRLRLPARVPDASSSSAPSTSRPSTSTSARTRSTATPPPARAAAPSRTVLDALFHRLVTWLAPMLPFTMEEVWLDPLPRRGQLGAPPGLPRHPARLARRRARREVGGRSAASAASSPARSRSSAATSASAPASRPRPSSTSPTPPSAPRSPRSTSPTSASPRTCA